MYHNTHHCTFLCVEDDHQHNPTINTKITTLTTKIDFMWKRPTSFHINLGWFNKLNPWKKRN